MRSEIIAETSEADMDLAVVILVAVAFTAVIGWPRNRRR
jgi:hypothetical protein